MYRLENGAYVRDNGDLIGNRPLYGAASSFRLVAGDRPLFALSLGPDGGKIASLYIGFEAGGQSKWLHNFTRRHSEYQPGYMRYELADAELGVECSLAAVPLAEGAGAAWRLELSRAPVSCRLIWALGGASGYHANYLFDARRWRLAGEDAADNRVELAGPGLLLHAPNLASGYSRMSGRFVEHHWPKPVFAYQGTEERLLAATCDFEGDYRAANAGAAEASPLALWQSEADDCPVAVFRSAEVGVGFVGHIAARTAAGERDVATFFAMPPARLFAAGRERAGTVAGSLAVRSPEPELDAACRAMAVAEDGAWVPPSFLHGAWSWMQHYLGWRGWYGATCLGWHERVRQAITAHLATQLQEGPNAGAVPHMLEDRGIYYNMTEVFLNQVLHHLEWTGDLELGQQVFGPLVDLLAWEKRTFDPDDDGLYENAINTWCSDNHWYLGGGCVQSSAYNYAANRGLARLARALGRDERPFNREAERILAAANRQLWQHERGCFAEFRDYLGLRRWHGEPELASIYHPIECELADEEQALQMLALVRRTFQWENLANGGKLVWSSNWYPVYPNGRQHSTRDLIFAECLNTASAFARTGAAEELIQLLRGAVAATLAGPMPGGLTCHANPDGSQRVNEDFTDAISMFLRVVVEDLFGLRPRLLSLCSRQALSGERLVAPCLPDSWQQASLATREHEIEWERDGGWRLLRLHATRPALTTVALPLGDEELAPIEVSVPGAEVRQTRQLGRSLALVRFQGDEVALKALAGSRAWQVAWPRRWVEGESIVIRAAGALVESIRDPQSVLVDLGFAEGGVRARVAQAMPGAMLFARVRPATGDPSWEPLWITSLPALEARLLAPGKAGAGWALMLRNNAAAPLSLAAQASGHFTADWQGTLAAGEEKPIPLTPTGTLLPGAQHCHVRLSGDTERKETLAAHLWELGELAALAKECRWEHVDLSAWRNCPLEKAFSTLDVMSPAAPYPLSQRYMKGVEFDGKAISADTLLAMVDGNGELVLEPGLRFGLGPSPNLAVRLSRWAGQPTRLDVPLSGAAAAAYLLLAALTTAMQSHITNAVATVYYQDGGKEQLELVNPINLDAGLGRFGPYHYGEGLPVPLGKHIECDEAVASTAHAPDAKDTNKPPLPVVFLGVETHADAYCLPLDPNRPLRRFTFDVLANEVVLAVLGLSLLQRG
ncbi:MAG: DUF4450 domain-containing protein [Anaerolineae bacterium]